MAATKLWYPHHIEKYRRKTGHLTLAEHGAYRLLMDWYWDRRGPLPAKEDRLRRYLRADCREWKKIREAVLEFFVLTEDGYRHDMIDETLAEAERQYEAKKDRIAKAREAKAAKRASNNSSDDRDNYRDDHKPDHKPEINSDGGTPSSSSSHILTDTEGPRESARARAPTQSVSVSRETKPGKGTRLPSDWKLTMSLLAWSMAAENDDETGQEKRRAMSRMEVLSEADKFRDYWHAKRGADACKCDWDATWRNWIRRACEQRPPSSASTGPARGYASHADPVAVGRRLIGESENEDAVPRERTAL